MRSRRIAPEALWAIFQEQEKLTDKHIELFKRYYDFLIQENTKINLTAVTGLKGVLYYHFVDSFIVREFMELKDISLIADVGAGAGFPAIPLKIVYPHLKVILIEVTKKKRKFLSDLISILELTDVEICDLDWRTFLRTTKADIDLFVSRAALGDAELCRMFRHNCPYRTSQMIYWASEQWQPSLKTQSFVRRVEEYKVHRKRRKLVFLGLPEE
jgi:16S rRNA (guanine527-N7)-methyltransferase